MSQRPEYYIWHGMLTRCYKPSSNGFHNYGGRGIKVCERWRTFANFFADMGERPSPKLTLDRINNDGDYEPGNCRWATWKEQYANKRRTAWNKLTAADARKIRADPRKYYEIAKDYNVTRPMVGYIKQGKSFPDVGGSLVTRPYGTTKILLSQHAAIHADTRLHRVIAKDYGVSRSTISRIKRLAPY